MLRWVVDYSACSLHFKCLKCCVPRKVLSSTGALQETVCPCSCSAKTRLTPTTTLTTVSFASCKLRHWVFKFKWLQNQEKACMWIVFSRLSISEPISNRSGERDRNYSRYVAGAGATTGSYCKLINKGDCSIAAAMPAVFPKLDNISSLGEEQKTARKAFSLLLSGKS